MSSRSRPGSSGANTVVALFPDLAERLDADGKSAPDHGQQTVLLRPFGDDRLFDALMDEENGAVLADVPAGYYGVVVKALLAHRAQWGAKGSLLEQLYGPHGQGQYVSRRDHIARVLGYGRPLVEEAMTCAANRATLIGHGAVTPDGSATLYRVPLPASLERVTEPRSITLTLAWFSHVNVRHRAYRRAKLELQLLELRTSAGVSRAPEQPSDKSVPRGSLFHVRYHGDNAVAFVDDGHMHCRVFCRKQGGALDQPIRYGMAVTVEAGEGVPVYQEIRQRLGIQPQVATNAP